MSRARILIAKPGLDGHDRGARYVARLLRDAGYDVVYTGIRQTPEQVAEAAIEGGFDAVGLSVLSGAHRELFKQVIDRLKARGAGDIVVLGGGTIPEDDFAYLKSIGVRAIFTPGASAESILAAVDGLVGLRSPSSTLQEAAVR